MIFVYYMLCKISSAKVKNEATLNLPNFCCFFPVFRKDCSPGPGYFIEASITRAGKDGTPVYSILGRQKDPSKYFENMSFKS